jgi:hypothetical protein
MAGPRPERDSRPNGRCDDASTHGTVPALAFGQMRAPESRSAARLLRTTSTRAG